MFKMAQTFSFPGCEPVAMTGRFETIVLLVFHTFQYAKPQRLVCGCTMTGRQQEKWNMI